MTQQRRVFVLAGGAAWEGPLLTQLDSLPDIMLVRRCIDVSDLLAASKTDQAEIALIDPSIPGLDLDVVDRLKNNGIEIWAVGPGGDRLGVEFNITGDDLVSIGERLRSVPTSQRSGVAASEPLGEDSPHDNKHGRVIAVWGTGGGPGRSTIALGLASSLARSGESVLLIDADISAASIAQMFAILDDVSGILAACRDVNLGRSRKLDEHILRVMPGLDVLTGIPRADLWHHIRPAALSRVIDHARTTHQHIVIDCSFDLNRGEEIVPSPSEITEAVIGLADLTLLVGRPDPVGIARTLRAAEEAKDHAQELAIVFNGLRQSTPWSKTDIADMVFRVTQQHPLTFLPFDAVVCDRALLRGEPVTEAASDSQLAKSIVALTDMIRSTLEPVTVSAS